VRLLEVFRFYVKFFFHLVVIAYPVTKGKRFFNFVLDLGCRVCDLFFCRVERFNLFLFWKGMEDCQGGRGTSFLFLLRRDENFSLLQLDLKPICQEPPLPHFNLSIVQQISRYRG